MGAVPDAKRHGPGIVASVYRGLRQPKAFFPHNRPNRGTQPSTGRTEPGGILRGQNDGTSLRPGVFNVILVGRGALEGGEVTPPPLQRVQ